MAVTTYIENGIDYWQVYVNLRSAIIPTIRLQKRVKGLTTEKAALSEEKRLLTELTLQIAKLEAQGEPWELLIDRWEHHKLTYKMNDLVDTTIRDYAQLLRNWTKIWFAMPASQLTRGDGREVLRLCKDSGKPLVFVRRLKNIINLVYTWGIEERLIIGVHTSPVYGIDIGKDKEEKLPEILTRNETQLLITQADEKKHKWASVWKGGLLTGMRSGELHALPWSNIEMIREDQARVQDELESSKRRYGLIRVHRTWNTRMRSFGPTKGGYWRTIPISRELYWFLVELKVRTGQTEFVFPRFWEWDKGQQAQVLRKFCAELGLKSIKFHTLRAVFATLLIQCGVAPTRVMKVCGWKDLKTMQRYIRMAGIDEQGATNSLMLLGDEEETLRKPATPATQKSVDLETPRATQVTASGEELSTEAHDETADNQVMNKVVSIFDFKARR
jgi:integrase